MLPVIVINITVIIISHELQSSLNWLWTVYSPKIFLIQLQLTIVLYSVSGDYSYSLTTVIKAARLYMAFVLSVLSHVSDVF